MGYTDARLYFPILSPTRIAPSTVWESDTLPVTTWMQAVSFGFDAYWLFHIYPFFLGQSTLLEKLFILHTTFNANLLHTVISHVGELCIIYLFQSYSLGYSSIHILILLRAFVVPVPQFGMYDLRF
jgi:hypothetical protein